MNRSRFSRYFTYLTFSGCLGLACSACQPRRAPASTTTVSRPASPDAPEVKSSVEALSLPSLAAKYQPHFPLGVAVEPYLISEQGEVIAKHFTRVVAENSMKWGEVCRSEQRCNFGKADQIAEFARSHHLKMTGHTFVWHQMYPAWLFKDGASLVSKEKLSERLRAHIFRMVERYADVVDNWDVVNEAVSDKPGKIYRDGSEGSKWFEVFGSEEYVSLAFRYASEAVAQFAPETKLYYNDYSIENQEKRDKVLTMVRALRAKGARIDGIGVQGHINLQWPSKEALAATVEDFAKEKLLVKISELDISVYPNDDFEKKQYEPEVLLDAALEAKLSARYLEVFQVFREHSKSISSVTLWGLSDDHSWLNGWPIGRHNYPLLFNRSHGPKAALRELLK